jgi:hypothetical protein
LNIGFPAIDRLNAFNDRLRSADNPIHFLGVEVAPVTCLGLGEGDAGGLEIGTGYRGKVLRLDGADYMIEYEINKPTMLVQSLK